MAAVTQGTGYPPSEGTSEVLLYDHEYLKSLGKVSLPEIRVNGKLYKSFGRFVFFSSNGNQFFAVVQLSKESRAFLDYAVVSFPTETCLDPLTITTTTIGAGRVSPSGSWSVPYGGSATFSFSPDKGYTVADVLVDGNSFGERDSYTFDSVRKDHNLKVVFKLDPAYAVTRDYFGVDVANTHEYVKTSNGESWLWTSTVLRLNEKSLPLPTYVVQETGGGKTTTSWYEKTYRKLGLRRAQSDQGKLSYSRPLIHMQQPLSGDDHWVSRAVASDSKGTNSVELSVDTLQRRIVKVPAGIFLAYPVSYTMKISGAKGDSIVEWTEYFAPQIGTVKVVSSEGKMALQRFAVGKGFITFPPPVVTGVLPATSSSTDRVTISGYHFGAVQSGSTVKIGGTEAQVLSWADRSIQVLLPQGSSGPVVVSTLGWKSNNDVEYDPVAASSTTALHDSFDEEPSLQ